MNFNRSVLSTGMINASNTSVWKNIKLFLALSQYRIEINFHVFFSQELYGIYPLQRNFCIRNTMCNDDTVMYFQSIQT